MSSMSLASSSNGSYHNGSGIGGGVGGDWIREGPVSTKEDGLRSMFFSKRYAVLRTSALTFHKSKEVSCDLHLIYPPLGRPNCERVHAIIDVLFDTMHFRLLARRKP